MHNNNNSHVDPMAISKLELLLFAQYSDVDENQLKSAFEHPGRMWLQVRWIDARAMCLS